MFTDNNHKRSKTRKNASKKASESAQLEKNNFPTEKIYFSNREIKFSQLAVSDFTVGFTSNCFFVKFFCVEVYPIPTAWGVLVVYHCSTHRNGWLSMFDACGIFHLPMSFLGTLIGCLFPGKGFVN